jgi:hypothetical protein
MAFPQLTREQMMERCDLAVIARVIAVGRASSDSPTLAKLVLLKIVKGASRERGGFVHVRLHGRGRSAPESASGLEAWSDWRDYKVGAVVMTHLDWNGPDALYETTWPGAVREVDAAMAKVA